MLDSLRSLPVINHIPFVGKSQGDGDAFAAARNSHPSSASSESQSQTSFTKGLTTSVGIAAKQNIKGEGRSMFLGTLGNTGAGRVLAGIYAGVRGMVGLSNKDMKSGDKGMATGNILNQVFRTVTNHSAGG